jgi:glycosyltransferase involved in cell wall biosynthesis
MESLLAQTYREVRFVLVDDASHDSTVEQARTLGRMDNRLTVEVNASRLGMVANWNRALDRAQASAPSAEYFAWGSDHDRWDSGWLAEMVAALDESPDAVLAYPRSRKFDDRGERVASECAFDTSGLSQASGRLRLAARRMPAGDMIYGLFRLSALRAVAPFPAVIYPDRLLLARLASKGQFVQVPRVLWFRRITAPSTPRRQRRTLFAGAAAPLHSRLPWWIWHARLLAPEVGVADAAAYAASGAWLAARTVPTRLKRRIVSRRDAA